MAISHNKIIKHLGSILAIAVILLLIIRSNKGQYLNGLALVKVGGVSVKAEIADNEQTRVQGLSGRANLENGRGMLFVFDKPGRSAIWMKDMNFPIDILWFKDGRLVDFVEDALPPKPGTPDGELHIYQPYLLSDYVLEVNSGFVENQGLKIGDPVEIIK